MRCFFRDGDVAQRYQYKHPDSPAVVFAQSFYACRNFIIFFCVLGAVALSSGYLYLVQQPLVFDDKSGLLESGEGLAKAVAAVWAAVWCAGGSLLLMGSHMWYSAALEDEFAVNPKPPTEVKAHRTKRRPHEGARGNFEGVWKDADIFVLLLLVKKNKRYCSLPRLC